MTDNSMTLRGISRVTALLVGAYVVFTFWVIVTVLGHFSEIFFDSLKALVKGFNICIYTWDNSFGSHRTGVICHFAPETPPEQHISAKWATKSLFPQNGSLICSKNRSIATIRDLETWILMAGSWDIIRQAVSDLSEGWFGPKMRWKIWFLGSGGPICTGVGLLGPFYHINEDWHLIFQLTENLKCPSQNILSGVPGRFIFATNEATRACCAESSNPADPPDDEGAKLHPCDPTEVPRALRHCGNPLGEKNQLRLKFLGFWPFWLMCQKMHCGGKRSTFHTSDKNQSTMHFWKAHQNSYKMVYWTSKAFNLVGFWGGCEILPFFPKLPKNWKMGPACAPGARLQDVGFQQVRCHFEA